MEKKIINYKELISLSSKLEPLSTLKQAIEYNIFSESDKDIEVYLDECCIDIPGNIMIFWNKKNYKYLQKTIEYYEFIGDFAKIMEYQHKLNSCKIVVLVMNWKCYKSWNDYINNNDINIDWEIYDTESKIVEQRC